MRRCQKRVAIMPYTERLPSALYRAAQVRALDRTAIEGVGIPGLTLMERAGSAAFELLRDAWPEVRHVTVICGTGNNGGDGLVLARHALQAGMQVQVLQLGDSGRITGDARNNLERFIEAGGKVEPFSEITPAAQVIVDGIFGTGLEREVSGAWRQAIEAINLHPSPVLALDIPSGLHSDTGQVLGVAVNAEATISFIGLKQGLFAGAGPGLCGWVCFSDLEVPEEIYRTEAPSALRVGWEDYKTLLGPRATTAHKGHFGHVLVIGGERGFTGAARMAAEAALRSGAGLVSLATRREHAALLNMGRPELMCHGVEGLADLEPLLKRSTVVAIGPGLGQGDWGAQLLDRVLETKLPLVVDADALNLLALEPVKRDNWILTPHPGEAARLLGCAAAEVQADRFKAVRALQEIFGGIAVLKGAGTLICAGPGQSIALCREGNPGMASGGMGDVLTGVTAALLAQGLSLDTAAMAAVCLHGAAGDRAARQGQRGLLATDLLPELRWLLNSEPAIC
jgi:NAD(P)H-hydrate epimerase